MRIIVILVGGIVAAIAGWFLGGQSAKAALANTGSVYDTFEMTESGWLFSDNIGSADAPPIERARVALGGPLGLSASEVIYFIATIDRDGDTLISSCTYRVTGPVLDTRWWSLTLYDFETQNYVPNDLRRSSFNNHNVPRADDGSWQILVSPTDQEGAWLPSQSEPDQQFELNLRLYNPIKETRQAAPNIELPIVEKVSC